MTQGLEKLKKHGWRLDGIDIDNGNTVTLSRGSQRVQIPFDASKLQWLEAANDVPYKDPEKLQELIEKYGTYRNVANALGVHERTIANWAARFQLDATYKDARKAQKQALDNQRIETIRAYIDAGALPSYRALAKELGISVGYVANYINAAKAFTGLTQ